MALHSGCRDRQTRGISEVNACKPRVRVVLIGQGYIWIRDRNGWSAQNGVCSALIMCHSVFTCSFFSRQVKWGCSSTPDCQRPSMASRIPSSAWGLSGYWGIHRGTSVLALKVIGGQLTIPSSVGPWAHKWGGILSIKAFATGWSVRSRPWWRVTWACSRVVKS